MPKLTKTVQKKQLEELFLKYQNDELATGYSDQLKFKAFCDTVLQGMSAAEVANLTPQQFLEKVEALEVETFKFKTGDGEDAIVRDFNDVKGILDRSQKAQEAEQQQVHEAPVVEQQEGVEEEEEEKEKHSSDPLLYANVDFSAIDLKKFQDIFKPNKDGSGFDNVKSITDSAGKVIGAMCDFKISSSDLTPTPIKFMNEKGTNKIIFEGFNEEIFRKTVQKMYDMYGPNVQLKMTGNYGDNAELATKILQEEKLKLQQSPELVSQAKKDIGSTEEVVSTSLDPPH